MLANLVLSFGARPPYSRAFDAVLGFLRDVSEPYPADLPAVHPVDRAVSTSARCWRLIVLYVVRSDRRDSLDQWLLTPPGAERGAARRASCSLVVVGLDQLTKHTLGTWIQPARSGT